MSLFRNFVGVLASLTLILVSPVSAAKEISVESAFLPLTDGIDALKTRLTLINEAKLSLDLQYYIWHRDKTGRLLLSSLLDAAERGVRIRLLLDDMNLAEDRDLFRLVDLHPLIEVRIFNPLKYDGKGLSKIARIVELLLDFRDKNKRMHNKMILADQRFAIVGGRNIGDEYFDLKQDESFRDLDIFAEGPVSVSMAKSFEAFWNNPVSVPFFEGVSKSPQIDLKAEAWQQLRGNIGLTYSQTSEGLPSHIMTLQKLDDLRSRVIWAPGESMTDSPNIFSNDTNGVEDQLKKWPEPTRSLLIESAYFIPTQALLRQFQKFLAQGAHIKVLTNSLQSNDVLLAHAGYMGKREEVLQMGIDLFEWRPHKNQSSHAKSGNPYGSQAGLHSKAYVIDDEYVFVGSVNLDGRSIHINTENGLMIHSRELAELISKFIKNGMKEETSWKLRLACPKSDCDKDDEIVLWTGKNEGQHVTFDDEPEEGFWQRSIAKILSHMPFKNAL